MVQHNLQVVTDALIVRAPPVTGGRKGRIYYATQAAVRPYVDTSNRRLWSLCSYCCPIQSFEFGAAH
jgi:hypothetical protein